MNISREEIRKWILIRTPKHDNVNDHRAAAKVLQAEKAARPAAPCASYCYHAFIARHIVPANWIAEIAFCKDTARAQPVKFTVQAKPKSTVSKVNVPIELNDMPVLITSDSSVISYHIAMMM